MEEVDNFTESLKKDVTITISINDGEHEFQVPKSLLCDASDYFVKVLDGKFREASDKTLHFPDCSAETVKLFLYWLCHKSLPDFDDDCYANATERYAQNDTADRLRVTLMRLWMFGDAYFMPKLQDAAMKSICYISHEWRTTASLVRHAYIITPKDSVVRKMFTAKALEEYFTCVNEDSSISTGMLPLLVELPDFLPAFMKPIQDNICQMYVNSSVDQRQKMKLPKAAWYSEVDDYLVAGE